MAEAIQPNMRSTNISITSFQNIIADYLSDFRFPGIRVLDIGPGQLDLLDIAKEEGSAQTVGVDFDPAIQALGDLRGHDVRIFNLTKGWPLPDQTFDLIFCRGSINCFWYPSEIRLREFLDGLSGSLADSGRLWIAPWNKPAPNREGLVDVFDATVSDWAQRNGITVETPDPGLHARYGIGYKIPRVEIWTR